MLTRTVERWSARAPRASQARSALLSDYYSVPTIVRWSFLAFTAAMPLEAVDLPFTSASPAKLTGLLFIGCYLFFYNPLSGKRPFPPGSAALSCFLAYFLVFAANGLFLDRHHFHQFISIFGTLAQLLLLFWISAGLLRVALLARGALLAFAIGAVICAAGTLLHVPGFTTIIQSSVGARVTALDFNPNYVAYTMAVAAIILIATALELKERFSWNMAALILLVLPLLAMLVRTGSRTGLAAFAVGFAAYLFSTQRQSGGRVVGITLAVFFTAALVFFVSQNPTVLTRLEQSYEGNLAGRQLIIPASIDMILERPFLGWQPVAYWEELARRVGYVWGVKDAHNLFFHLLLEVGLLGAVPFIVGLWLCLRGAWKVRAGKFGNLPFVLLVMTLSANLSHTYLARKPQWLILALAVAAAATVAQRSAAARYLIRHPLRRADRPAPAFYRANARARQF
jgi:O-antigen ligase